MVEARTDKGISEPAELARLAKVSAAAAYAWESGDTKSLKGEVLIRVSDVLEVHPRWLMTGRGPKHEVSGLPMLVSQENMPAEHVQIEHLAGFDVVNGPRYAVLPEILVRRKIGDTPIEHVRWVINPSPAMAPVIEQGALVFVDTRYNSLESVIDGATYAYRLWKRPDLRKIVFRDQHHVTLVGHGKGAPLTDVYEDKLPDLEIGGLVLGSS